MPANPHATPRVELLDLNFAALNDFVQTLGEPGYRAGQLWQWLWTKGCRELRQMTNLSRTLREKLAESAAVIWPEVAVLRRSSDGTVKFLLRLGDGAAIETVLIPEKDHYTQCLSTQVGCAMGCLFCSTGQAGFTRNLSSGEICAQVLLAREYLAAQGSELRLRNLVFMGMGEPLCNLDGVLRSLETLNHPQGLNFSPRRMTVSTVGLPGPLERLGQAGLCALAVSLHAPTQELRARLMPKAGLVPLPELMAALDRYPLKPRQRITCEYILLDRVNDSLAEARQLVRLLGGRRAKVNLIAYNPPPEGSAVGPVFAAPEPGRVLAFEQLLHDKGLTVTLRKSKGQDIGAACGQLKAAAQ